MDIKKILILAVAIPVAAGCSKKNLSAQQEDALVVYPTAAGITTDFCFVGGNDYKDGVLLFGESFNEVENGTSDYMEIYNGHSQQTLILTGLNPSSEYYYRTRVIKNGDYEYGPMKSFITAEPISISAALTGKSSNYLNFELSFSDPLNYTVTSFGVQYATSYAGVSKGVKTTSKSTSVKIEKLQSGTKYYYRPFAVVNYPDLGITDYIYGSISEAETEKVSAEFYLTSYSAYPWEKTIARGNNGLASSNYYIKNSSSTAYLYVYTQQKCTISFNYGVSSEATYDTFTLKVDNSTVANAISGSKSGSYTKDLDVGEHTIYLTYVKDNTGNSGDDEAYIYNIAVDGKYISNADIYVY